MIMAGNEVFFKYPLVCLNFFFVCLTLFTILELLLVILSSTRVSLSDFDSLSEEDVAENNQLAFDVAEREFGIQPVIRGEEMAAQAEPDQLLTVFYLSKFYEAFRISPGNGSGQVPFCSVPFSNPPRLNIGLKIQNCLSAGRPGCTVELPCGCQTNP